MPLGVRGLTLMSVWSIHPQLEGFHLDAYPCSIPL